MEEMKARSFKIFKQQESPNDGNCRELLYQLLINFSSKFENPIIERLPSAVTFDCRQNAKVMHSLMRNLEDNLELRGLDRFADDVQSIRQFTQYTLGFLCRTVDKLAQSHSALLKNKLRGGSNKSQCVVCGHRLEEVRIAAIRQRLAEQHEPQILPEWQNCRFSNKFKPVNSEDIRQLYCLAQPIDFDEHQNSSSFYDAILTDMIIKKDNINLMNNDRTIKVLEDFLKELFGIHANGSVQVEASDIQFLTQFKIGRDIVNQLYDQFSTNVKGMAKKEVMPAIHRLAKQFELWERQRKNMQRSNQSCQTDHREQERPTARITHKQRSQSSILKQQLFLDQYRGATTPKNKTSTFRQSAKINDRTSRLSPSKAKKISVRNEGVGVGDDKLTNDSYIQAVVDTNTVETQTPNTQIIVEPKSSADLFLSTLSALHRKANTTTEQKLPTSDAILKVMNSSDMKLQTISQNLSHPLQSSQVRISNIQSIEETPSQQKVTVLPTIKKLQKLSQKKKQLQTKTDESAKQEKENKSVQERGLKSMHPSKKISKVKPRQETRKSIEIPSRKELYQAANTTSQVSRIVDLDQLRLEDYKGEKIQLAKIRRMLSRTESKQDPMPRKGGEQNEEKQLEEPVEHLQEQPSVTQEATVCNQNKQTSIAFIPNSNPTTRRNHSQLQTEEHHVIVERFQKRLASLIEKLSHSHINSTFLRRLFRTVEYAVGNQDWLKGQDMVAILDRFRPRITTLQAKSFNIPLPDTLPSHQSTTDPHPRMSQYSRSSKQTQQDRTSIIKEGVGTNQPSNFSMMLKQFRRQGKEKLKTEHIIDQSADAIKLPRILTKNHIPNKETDTCDDRKVERSLPGNDIMKIPGTNLYVKRNTKARPYGQHVFSLEDLNIYGGVVEAYNFEVICTKNSLKKHKAMKQPEEVGWLASHMSDVYASLEQLRVSEPPKYHQIKSFLRYPYQTVCNDFKVIDTTEQLSRKHFEEMYGMLVRRHLVCKADGLCRHIRGFLKRLDLQIQ